MEKANPVLAPGVDAEIKEDDDELLEGAEKATYGTCVGKAIFMASERPEAQYAIKEMAREIGQPTKRAWRALRHFGRYLLGTPTVELKYSKAVVMVEEARMLQVVRAMRQGGHAMQCPRGCEALHEA